MNALLCLAQNDESIITFRQNLRNDLPIFKQLVTSLHPIYNKPGIREQVSGKIDSLYRLGQPLTISQVASVFKYVDIGDLCADTHSYFSWQQSGFKVWPYVVRIIGNSLYINQDSVDIPFAAEITVINGHPVRQLLDALHSSGNRYGADSTMDLSGVEAALPIIWSEEYGPQRSFDVEYRYENRERHATIEAIPVETYLQVMYPRRVTPSAFWKSKEGKAIDYDIDKATRTATLYLNTFNFPPDTLKTFLDSIFGKLRGDSIGQLVIDLTRNGGGLMNNVPLLYSYLTDRPFGFSLTLSADKKDIPYRKYLTGIDYSPLNGQASREIDNAEQALWGGFRKIATKRYEEKLFQTPFEPVAPEKRFSGAVYILISGQTYSAACAFATLARVNKRALLFGTQAGGNVHFMNAAILLQYRLPNSGMEFSVPVCYVNLDFADSSPEDKCSVVKPDQNVTAAVILQMFLNRNGNPPALNKLLEYIKKDKSD
ncbi:MAG: hypothetical protein J0H74_06970 [Chitinophagaceae bacterium]|nr:hypothetical protein [Chitinophagaceae bacterium]